MTMSARLKLAGGVAVAGMLRRQSPLADQRGTVHVTSRLTCLAEVRPSGRCRDRSRGCVAWTIVFISLLSPTVVVAAVAHPASTTEGKQRQCANAKGNPDPTVHCRVPSLREPSSL
jgi:hypothetical protein